MKFLLLISFIFTFFTSINHVFAAQDGRVLVENAVIYEKPDIHGTILYRAAKGEVLRISEQHKDGWRRVLLPKAISNIEFGWMRIDQIEPDSLQKDLRSAGIATTETRERISTRKHLVFSGFYGFSYSRPEKMQEYIGAPPETLTYKSFFWDLGYRLTEDWLVSARYSQPTIKGQARVVGQDHSYSITGKNIGLLVGYTLHFVPPVRIGLSIGSGALYQSKVMLVTSESVSTRVAGLNVPRLVPHSNEATSVPFVLTKLDFRWYMASFFALAFDVGYQYMRKKSVPLSTADTVEAQLSGAFFSMGLQFEI